MTGAAAVAALVLGGACGGGGGGGDRQRALAAATSTTSSTALAASVTAAPATAAAASPPTIAGRTPRTTAPARAATTSSTPSPSTTAARSAPAPGLTFATPGTYRYATTGSFTSTLTGTQSRTGQKTLTVDPPSGSDQHSVLGGLGQTTDQVLRLDGGSAYLVSLHLTDTGVDKEVRPSPPALAVPGDAAPGRTWSWRAMSTDGKTVVDSSFTAVRTEDVSVGAERVPALVVEVVLALSGDIMSTSRQTLWLSAGHRIVLRQDESTNGRFGLFTFSSTSTDSLLSLTPG